MKSKERGAINFIDDLKDIIKSYPIHYIIATASINDFYLTCDEAIKALESGRDQEYNLIGIYNQRNQQLTSYDDFKNYGSESYDALCPFHNDLKLGSYKITPSKGLYYCFACGANGDAISFEQQLYEIGFRQAVLHLAYRLGIISLEQLKEEKVDENTKNRLKKEGILQRNNTIKKQEKQKELKADFIYIHNFYRRLCDICGLTEEDKNHLLNERNVPFENLDNYFTFPTKENEDYVVNQILSREFQYYLENKFNKSIFEISKEEIAEAGGKNKMREIQANLIYTPGFYYDLKDRRIKMNNRNGIGLLCKNEKGLIEGIQVRNRYTYNNGPRYVRFSSGFALSKKDLKGGATPGCPGGFIESINGYGDNDILCITEGRFKAETIAKEGCPTIYVSGVSTWKSIKKMVKDIQPRIKEVYIMFDADMMGNTGVHGHLSAMAKYVRKTIRKPVSLIIWSKEKGKGYDDLVINNPNNYKQYIRKIPFDSFEKTYDKVLNFLLNKYNVKEERQIKNPNDAKLFGEQMQYTLEKIYRI